MNLTLTMNEDRFSSTTSTIPTGRVSACDIRPQAAARRGLNRTPGNLRLSAPSRVLSGAGLNNTTNTRTSGKRISASRGCGDKPRPPSHESIQQLRVSLTRMCEESRRRISGGELNRGSLHSRLSGASAASSTNSARSSIFGTSLRTSDLGGNKRASDLIRQSLMGTAISIPPPTSCLQWCSSYDIDGVDIDEQRRQLELFNNLVNDDDDHENFCEDCKPGKPCLVCAPDPEEEAYGFEHFPEEDHAFAGDTGDFLEPGPTTTAIQEEEEEHDDDDDDEVLIEVVPGVRMSLKTPEDTWAAVADGRITVTACTACGCELTCADDAEVVVCTDCWVFSPVDQSISSSMSSLRSSGRQSLVPPGRISSIDTVGSIDVGIKAETIFEWLETQDGGGTILEE